MEAKREKMEGMVLECGEEVKRSEGELVQLELELELEQLKEAEGRRKGVRRVGKVRWRGCRSKR